MFLRINTIVPLATAALQATVTAGCAAAAVSASAVPPAVHWIMKQDDLTRLRSAGLSRAVTFQWTTCGYTTEDFDYGTDKGIDRWGSCHAGQVPTYTSEAQLVVAIRRGTLKRGSTALLDIEVWRGTPPVEQANPEKYIRLASELAVRKGIRLIQSPYARKPSVMAAEDVTAAKHGAFAVDIQAQFTNGRPSAFRTFVRSTARAIRKASKHVLIIVGLATNQPMPQTVANLVSDYKIAKAAGAQGFWLNAAKWQPNHCSAAQGGFGCPLTGIAFLRAIRAKGA
jgi:hypothetical protein